MPEAAGNIHRMSPTPFFSTIDFFILKLLQNGQRIDDPLALQQNGSRLSIHNIHSHILQPVQVRMQKKNLSAATECAVTTQRRKNGVCWLKGA
jgi:hypothetical protein